MRPKTLALASAAALAAAVTVSAETAAQAKAPQVIDLVQTAEVNAAQQSWTAAIDAYKQAVAESAKDPRACAEQVQAGHLSLRESHPGQARGRGLPQEPGCRVAGAWERRQSGRGLE